MRLTITLGLMFVLLSVSPVSADVIFWSAIMEGSQVVPPVATSASGFASGTLDTNANLLSWSIQFQDMSGSLTAALFHEAPAGANGPTVVAALLGFGVSPLTGSASTDEAFEAALLAGDIYLSLHNSAYPAGELRGQIEPVPEPATVGLLFAGGAFLALLRRVLRTR